MKSKKRFLSTVMFIALFSAISALTLNVSSDASGTGKINGVSLKIGNKTVTKKTYSLKKGKSATLKVNVTPKNAKKSVEFKTSNKKTATVSAKGVIAAKKVGTAKITVVVKDSNGKSASTWMKVKVKGNSSAANAEDDPEPTPTPDPITVKDYYVEDGSKKIYGKIYTPEKEGVYPAVIMCHGYNGVGTDFVTECTYFAQNGYIAYAFDFCGGSGRSKSTGKSTDMTIFTEKDDLITVFKNIKELSNVDSNRVFLHGGSQGGLVAALAAEELGDEVKGLMLYFPAFNIPYDWTNMHPDVNKIPEVIPWWGLDLGREFAVSVHGYKTFDHIGSYSKNVLILYGAKDTIVQRTYVDQAKELYQNCELIVYPNEGHGFTPSGVNNAKVELLNFMNAQ